MKKLMAMTNFLCMLVLLSGCGGSRNQNSQPADKMKIPNYITPPVHRIVKEPTGPKVKITAFIDTPSFSGDEDFFIHEDCENLIIGGMPMTINRIRGLEKLTKVKRLVLYVICDQGGGPSDVTDYITQLKNVEVLTIQSCWRTSIDFIQGFEHLKILYIDGSYFDALDTFSLEKNKRLKTFVMVNGSIKGQGNNIERNMKISIQINPPASLERIILDTNFRALTLDTHFLEMNKRSEIFVSKEAYQYGMNDHGLVSRYQNVHVVDDNDLKKYYPEEISEEDSYDIFHDGSYEIIGG